MLSSQILSASMILQGSRMIAQAAGRSSAVPRERAVAHHASSGREGVAVATAERVASCAPAVWRGSRQGVTAATICTVPPCQMAPISLCRASAM